MAREHGRFGRVEIAATNAATTRDVVQFISDWSIEFTADRVDVTAIGDVNKTYVQGLPDAQGTFNGFFDTENDQFYTAATDGLDRAFRLYYTDSTTTDYFEGRAFFDFSISGSVSDAKKMTSKWAASGPVTKVTA